MGIRKALMLAAAAILGAAVAVLPAVASAETAPTVEAYSYGLTHYWTPEALTVSEGATVAVDNASKEVPHGVEWKSGPERPSCTGVPVAPEPGRTSWTGTCTFAKSGTY